MKTQTAPTVLDEFVRLDGLIRDCNDTLSAMDRARQRGRSVPMLEWESVNRQLSAAVKERNALDAMLYRYNAQPNPPDHEN